MTIEEIIVTIRNELIRSISALDEWFDEDETLLAHRPSGGEWNGRELLEQRYDNNTSCLRLALTWPDGPDEPARVRRRGRC